MKKINLIAFTCLLLTLIIPKVEAKDSHYLYKSENSNLQVLNENIEKMFINSNYKVLRTDKDTPFYYFIPVQLSYYDWFWWGKARVRYDNYFIISAKQVNNDVYLLLTK